MSVKEEYQVKIKDLAELKEKGLYIIEDDLVVVTNLPQILESKGLSLSDLAKLTGISRQNINAVIRNKMKPGIDFCLKVSYVLGATVEEVFNLTEDAWVKPYKIERDSAIFVDLLHLQIINHAVKRKLIAESGDKEYFDRTTKECFTKKKYEEMQKAFVQTNLEKKEAEVAKEHQGMSRTSINSIAVDELKKEFGTRYSKIYKRLGEKIQPYVLKS